MNTLANLRDQLHHLKGLPNQVKLLQEEIRGKSWNPYNIAAQTEKTSILNKPVFNLSDKGRDRLKKYSSIKRYKIGDSEDESPPKGKPDRKPHRMKLKIGTKESTGNFAAAK